MIEGLNLSGNTRLMISYCASTFGTHDGSQIPTYLLQTIVRSFLRDHDVVNVRFAQAGGGDAQKASV